MVKQQLWIVNSSLLLLCVLGIFIPRTIRQEVPVLRIKKTTVTEDKKPARIAVNLEKIYTNDLFDTYVPEPKAEPIKKNLVTPIPQLHITPQNTPPQLKKAEFLAPLPITVKGIIASPNEAKSIAMIADETGKEATYRLGDRIQDAQLIKLSRNRLVFLRSNGQQEVFFLRKPENLNQQEKISWEFAVKKEGDTRFIIDPEEFGKEITSIGQFVETLGLGTVFQNGQPSGIMVNRINSEDISSVIGLAKDDILTAINGINTNDPGSRTKIYSAIRALKTGSTVSVDVTRSGQPIKIEYQLESLKKPSKYAFLNSKDGKVVEEDKPALPVAPDAKRAQQRREFEQRHHTKEQQDQLTELMNKRLLENMKHRTQNRRIR